MGKLNPALGVALSLLTRGTWVATGYSSRLVCLFVCDR